MPPPELTDAQADGLLDVRLVMALVYEQEGRELASSELAATPQRTKTVDDGFVYAYERVAYGLIRRSPDGRGDFVWETRVTNGLFASRLFTRTGRLVHQDVSHPNVRAPSTLFARLCGTSPVADPTWN